MKNNFKLLLTGLVLLTVFQGCKQKEKKDNLDRFTNNNAQITVDESFRPIVDEELYVFKAIYNDVKPRIIYGPESTVINLLLEDTVRIAILSRDLTKPEYQELATRNLKPIVNRFAIDAVTLIVNQASNDTTITVSDIKKMLNGNTKQDKNIVFDNPNSGLVRYLKELSGNNDLKQKNIYALKSNKDVIKYVSENPNAIGITGFSWLNDPDKDYADAVAKVKIVSVKDDGAKSKSDQYYAPSQNTLALKQYPLTRNLYILNCTGNFGLGMKFAAFISSDRGQRIILKSGLLPDEIPGREINVVSKIKQ
ncbi:PstS family phosphate ABC transporter substrate-binding protein [Mucilaginibacter sp.]|uniref:PstS family phosphate ABC transporter substrate-binding protein n=1 Tax=Mucilaginibacter sp. TaxID=1882438 RepID=UPI003D107507